MDGGAKKQPRDRAPVRRYVGPPRDPHDWLRASSSVVWVYTPALQPLSRGYKSKVPNLRSYGATRADLTWTAVPRDSQEIAPIRRYVRPPRDSHDWLRASGSVVWVCTPALHSLSHGYKSYDPNVSRPWPWQLARGEHVRRVTHEQKKASQRQYQTPSDQRVSTTSSRLPARWYGYVRQPCNR